MRLRCMAAVGLVWLAWYLPGAEAAALGRADLLAQAAQHERQGRWAEAAECYEQLSARDRRGPDVNRRYLFCLRHVRLAQRHADPTYRQQLLTLDLPAALRLYAEVLAKVHGAYVEPVDAAPARLFRQGLDELQLALADEAFRRDYLPAASADALRKFTEQAKRAGEGVRSVADVERRATDLALAGERALGVRPAITVLELAAGACSGLDEYTSYLTPRQLRDAFASFRGEFVGVGIAEVASEAGRLVVRTVLPDTPASREGIQPEDRIRRIDRKPTDGLSADAALERLRGEPGSTVEIDIASANGGVQRTLTLVREAVLLHSVSEGRFLEPGIGYVQLSGFQESTVAELERTIADLRGGGLRVLILDLRGNPGGLFDVAVQVAQRFLSSGIVVATQSSVEGQSRTYEARTLDPFGLPMVVLVDGETASAAEVVAGAFKENHRALLVGQPTYGKGTVQCILRLDTSRGGIRVTLAKFFSPLGRPYQGVGVTPDVEVVQRSPAFDEQQKAAVHEARQMAARR